MNRQPLPSQTKTKQPFGVDEGNVFGLNNIFKIVGIDLADTSKDRPWTRDGKEYLVELYRRGWTVEEMAKDLNRTPGNVVGMIYDLAEAGNIMPEMFGTKAGGTRPRPRRPVKQKTGIQGKLYTPEEDALLFKLKVEKGMTGAEIAEELGRSRGSVYRRIARLKEEGKWKKV